MSVQSRLLPVVAITGSSLVVGCGGYSGGSCGSGGSYGSYGSYGACQPPRGVDPSGIYQGTVTNTATQQETPVIAIIAENGDARMSGADGTYYRLNVGTTGSQLSGSYFGYSQSADFPNGTLADSGTVSAVIASPGMTGTLTDQAGNVENLALNFDTVYNTASSLATLAGTWTYSANGFTLSATILGNGAFSATDSNSCTYTGSFGLIDSRFNAYSENYVRICNGATLRFTGLASYFPASGAAAPTEIELMADDDAGHYLIAALQ